MAKLTVKNLEALGESDVGRKILDEGGLRGVVRKNAKAKGGAAVTFYYRYRADNKFKDFSCGTWPTLMLAEIRQRRDAARLQLAEGVDPIISKRVAAQKAKAQMDAELAEIECAKIEQLTVRELFEAWVTRRHYLHYDYAKEMKDGWARLGNQIENILRDDILFRAK